MRMSRVQIPPNPFHLKESKVMARRRSPYVSASRMYRANRVPGEYYFLSFLINSVIVFFQLLWASIAFLISFTPSIIKITIGVFKIIYDIILIGVVKIIALFRK